MADNTVEYAERQEERRKEREAAVQAERDAIIEVIRRGSWSGSEEIVAMIKRRK